MRSFFYGSAIGLALLLSLQPCCAQEISTDAVRCNNSPRNMEQIKACTTYLREAYTPAIMASVYYLRALGYKELNQSDNAISDTSRAITLLSSYKIHNRRGIEVLSSSYALRAEIYKTKGLIDLSKADREQSLSIASQGIEEGPDTITYNNRAWTYHLMGEDAKGLPDAMKALELDPKNASAIETRAEIYEKLGRHDEAVADYRASLAIAPTIQSSKDGLARLGATP